MQLLMPGIVPPKEKVLSKKQILLSYLKIVWSQHDSGNQEIFGEYGFFERTAANGFRAAKTPFIFQIYFEDIMPILKKFPEL